MGATVASVRLDNPGVESNMNGMAHGAPGSPGPSPNSGQLDWNFSQVFGERTPGEEVQEGEAHFMLANLESQVHPLPPPPLHCLPSEDLLGRGGASRSGVRRIFVAVGAKHSRMFLSSPHAFRSPPARVLGPRHFVVVTYHPMPDSSFFCLFPPRRCGRTERGDGFNVWLRVPVSAIALVSAT